MMLNTMNSASWFGARTVVASALVLASIASLVAAQDGCRIECYPNTKVINGKGGVGKSDNCRWIVRTDGKPARLCDHIKCKKICPNNQAASSQLQMQQDQQDTSTAAATDNFRFEQKIEGDSPAPAGESQGIMRHLHGNKMAKAPVPGVAGGRLASGQQQQQPQQPQHAGRRMAPTLPPSVQYDENDTPPPISRFLDISPEE